MASSTKLHLALFIALSLYIEATLGISEVICENLPEDRCSFSVASSGKRCVLENYKKEDGSLEYTCKTSEVVVGTMACYMESDECVSACGVDRSSVGISSDAFLSRGFTEALCSPACYHNCPNIVDLYFNLAAAEGVFLPVLCQKQKSSSRREMLDLVINSSGVTVTLNTPADDSIAPTAAPTT